MEKARGSGESERVEKKDSSGNSPQFDFEFNLSEEFDTQDIVS